MKKLSQRKKQSDKTQKDADNTGTNKELKEQLQRAFEHNTRQGVKSWSLDEEEPLVVPDGLVDIKFGAYPRLFISYRWENAIHEGWVDHIVGNLFNRGYDVVYDRDPKRFDNTVNLDKLLGMISTCYIFVPILTAGYIQRISNPNPVEGGPVKMEWDIARQLIKEKKMFFIGMWRSGDIEGDIDERSILDFRNMNGWKEKMDARFPEVKVAILGIGKNLEGQVFGPLRRIEVRKVIEYLLTIENLEKIEIHPYPKNESHHLYNIFKDKIDGH